MSENKEQQSVTGLLYWWISAEEMAKNEFIETTGKHGGSDILSAYKTGEIWWHNERIHINQQTTLDLHAAPENLTNTSNDKHLFICSII